MEYYHKTMASPVGKLTLIAGGKGLAAVLWEHDDPRRVKVPAGAEMSEHPVLLAAERELNEYFSGRRSSFSIGLDLTGTGFQKQIWEALLTIPFGETRTYGQIARQIGKPAAVRAVGGAVNKNPVSIIAPCHRVIGASGQLTGFAGGLENKAALLRLESAETTGTFF
ncbi:methylated-DNA--[protein]-cysteine S-methyltransferase [Chitinophaga sp. GCM10012297]|uniref:Methylated-DNA--protein-cysteine methyltransferase n=1 Tax=Chitinophaga chungangae TaxID=2821488 RepID=A0ABS3YJ96_9BACT|nr:methylated-DNA--[protein]-cysteine S-methyltransferase [Chitinophaga chungangae]MBO9154761.1 methylated-DNA--[protein]-cysteine S-methyltransferase [Chitinophaga chungangae]